MRDPNGVQDELQYRIPCQKRNALFSQYHEIAHTSTASEAALHGVRPIAPTSVGRWKNHLPRLAGQIEIHGSINSDLIQYGYEKDDSWETVLRRVEPNLSPSHWPDFFTNEAISKRREGITRAAAKMLLQRVGVNPLWIRDRLKFARRLLSS